MLPVYDKLYSCFQKKDGGRVREMGSTETLHNTPVFKYFISILYIIALDL